MVTYVVFPHYIITAELELLALNAIRSFRPYGVTVISVDDASPKEHIVEVFSDVYLKNEENQGFAKTCNRGFQWILDNEKDDCWIVCANNDIEINKKVLPALQEPFSRFKNVAITGIVSTKAHEIEGKPLDKFSWNQISEGGLLRDRMQDGGLWMSKKSILQKIGLFDEAFTNGHEDIDLFLRARDTFGMKIVMSGMAAYWHKQGATRWESSKNQQSLSQETENAKVFAKKWGFPYQGNIWKEINLFTV